ncbi:DMT family transporter [Agitococcus lubricus]|uniref:EamA-like transporter family protein n=1 Tax=Agitococcus lubricus TaxID=1077255 RepID=A0A2T5IYF8_9GAMM|nr:DMT family transporter [Agitococcus lubricus]PTQ89005.1 EamA-like transporter family protein [Agitococcus lubricus]
MPNAAKADLLLVVVTLLAAVSWIMSKEAVMIMPPLLFMGLRFLLASGLLAVIGWQHLRQLDAYAIKRSMVAGLVFALGMSLWVMGLFTGTHVGEGAFLTSLGVVLVPVIGKLFFGEKQTRSNWLALPFAVVGLALLSLKNGFNPEVGQWFYVTAAFVFALFYRLNTSAANQTVRQLANGQQHVVAGVPPIALTSIVLAMVGIVASIISLVFEPWQKTMAEFSGAMFGWIVASAIIGTAARFLIQTYAQSLSQHTHGVVILVVEPVWVALLAAAWYGESMSGQQLVGCSLILLSLLVSRAKALKALLRLEG